MGLKTVIGSKHGAGRSSPIIPTPSEDAVIPDDPATTIAHDPVIAILQDPKISHVEPSPSVHFRGKESVQEIDPFTIYEQPGGGQSVQRCRSLDSSSESWRPTRVMNRHLSTVLGSRGGGPPTAVRVPRGDNTGVLGGGVSDGPGATGSGNTAAVDGHVAITIHEYSEVFLPNLVHRQRLIAAGRKAKMLWCLRFLVDGIVLTCLENSVDLSNGAQFGKIFMVYVLLFAFGVTVSSMRAEFLEDPPFKSSHKFELLVALLKFIYLVSLRSLHEIGISSGTKYVKVYSVFKCVFSVLIKLVSALTTLKSLNDKLKRAIHED